VNAIFAGRAKKLLSDKCPEVYAFLAGGDDRFLFRWECL
jgi:hypothetical protein